MAVSLVVKEWQYSDGSTNVNNPVLARLVQPSIHGSLSHQTRTGRRLKVTVVEGRNLAIKEKSGRCDPYIKLYYGKVSFSSYLSKFAMFHFVSPIFSFYLYGT